MQLTSKAGLALALLTGTSLVAAQPAAADTLITTNTTISTVLPLDRYIVQADTNGVSPTVNLVPGGSLSGGDLIFLDSSHGDISGGTARIIQSEDMSTVSISNVNLLDALVVYGHSTVTITGGMFQTVPGYYAGPGTDPIQDRGSSDSSLTIAGGTFGPPGIFNFYDNTQGSFSFIGSNLAAVDVGPDPNPQSTEGAEDYLLSGTLADGSSVTGDLVYVDNSAKLFTLNNASPVPEASTTASFGLLLALGLGGVVIAAKRRKAMAP